MPKDASLSTKTSAIKYLNGDKKFYGISAAKKKAAKKAYNKAVKEYGKAFCKEYIG
jgi:glycerol-3-phosphate responsive antiterminator